MVPGHGHRLPPLKGVEEAAVQDHAAENVVQVSAGIKAVFDGPGGGPKGLPNLPQPVCQGRGGPGEERLQGRHVLPEENGGVVGQMPPLLP